MDTAYSAPQEINRIQQLALIVGVIGIVLLAVGFFINQEQFFRSYLFGYVFWIGIALGCLAVLMLQHLTGGAWGLVIRRVLECGTRTIPLMLLLFVPLALGLTSLYEWTHAAQPGDEVLKHKQAYLNIPFFLGRAAIYFLIWLGLAYFLNKWSREQDRTAERSF